MTANPHTDFPAWCREHGACSGGQAFADNHPTLESFWNACQRPDWMLWVYNRLELSKNNDRALRLFAVRCARSVPQTDPRSIAAIDCAERFANGIAAMAELSAAWSAARSAAESAWSAARSAALSAAWSAAESAAESAARSAAESAAWSAAESAAESAARSAARSAAWSAARSAAWSAAESAAESAQANAMRRFITYQDLA
jgi:hypothetical protein